MFRCHLDNARQVEAEGSLQTTSTGSVLKASKVKFEDVSGSSNPSAGEFEFTGRVTALNGDNWTVGGKQVKVSAVTVFRRISRAQVVPGTLLEIKGSLLADGSVTAVRVSLED